MTKTFMVSGYSGGFPTAVNTTDYWGVVGSLQFNSNTEADNDQTFKMAGVFSLLTINITVNTIASGTTTVKLRKNAVNATQIINVSASQTGNLTDVTHTDTIAANDKIAIQTIPGATTGQMTIAGFGIVFDATTNAVTKFSSDVFASGASTTYYITPNVATQGTITTVEGNAKLNMLKAGTIKNAIIEVFTARATTTTVRSRKNVANGAILISLTASTTGTFSDAVNTDTVAATDDWCWQMVTGTGTTSMAASFQVDMETTDAYGAMIVGDLAGKSFVDAATYYVPIGGLISTTVTVEATGDMLTPQKTLFDNYEVNVTGNAVNIASSLSFRKNATTQFTISITASTTGLFTDTSSSATTISTDVVDHQIIVPSVAGSLSVTIAWICISEKYNPTVAYTATFTETTTVGAATMTRVAGKTRTLTDTITVGVGTLARLKAAIRTLTNTTTVTAGTFARLKTAGRSFSETITLGTNLLSRIFSHNRSFATNTTTVGAGTFARLKGVIRTLTDTTTVTAGTFARLKVAFRAITDTTTVGVGTFTRLKTAIRTFSNTTTLGTNLLVRIFGAKRSFPADTITVGTGTFVRLKAAIRPITDTIVVAAGTFTRLKTATRSFSNTITLGTNLLSRIFGAKRPFATNTIVVSAGTFTRLATHIRTFTNTTTVTDTLGRMKAMFRSFSNAITVGSGTFVRLIAFIRKLVGYNLNAMLFDGVNDQITLPANTSLWNNTNLTNFSFSLWLNPAQFNDGTNHREVFSRGWGAAYGFDLYFLANAPRLEFENIGAVWSTRQQSLYYDLTGLPLNVWYHVVVTFDSSLSTQAAKLYVNAVQATNYATNGAGVAENNASAPLMAGPNQDYNGLMKDFRWWNRTLSPAEITSLKNGDGPWDMDAWIPFDEGAGTPSEDKKGLVVTLAGGIGWSTTNAPDALLEKVNVVDVISRLRDVPRSFSNTITLTDSWIRRLAFLRTFSSPITVAAGTFTRLAAHIRTFSNATTVTDSWTRLKGMIRTFSNSITVSSGTFTRLATFFRTLVGYGNMCLAFDGIDDSLDLGNVASLWSQSLTKFSFSFWFKPDIYDATNNRWLVSHGGFSAQAFYVYCDGPASANRIVFTIRDATSATHSALYANIIFPGNWYHVVCTYDNSLGSDNMKIYVNGVLSVRAALTESINKSASLILSPPIDATNKVMDGSMKDFKWWSTRALAQSEVNSLYAGSGPWDFDAWVPINEGSGTPKELKKGNAITLGSAPVWTANAPDPLIEKINLLDSLARIKGALRTISNSITVGADTFIRMVAKVRSLGYKLTYSMLFDGVDDGLNLGNPSVLSNLTAGFTWTFWVYPTAAGTPYRGLVSQNYPNPGGYTLWYGGATPSNQYVEFKYDVAGVNYFHGFSDGGPPNQWYFVCIRWDNTTLKSYLRWGTQVSTSAARPSSQTMGGGGNMILAGENGTSASDFGGYMADVRFFRRPLTDAEVLQIMGGGWVAEPDLFIPFNEGSGIPKDIKANNAITLLSAPAYSTAQPSIPEVILTNGGAFTRLVNAIRTFSDSTTIGAGTFTRLAGKVRTFSNSITVAAGTFTRGLTHIRTFVNTVVISDTFTRLKAMIRAFATNTVTVGADTFTRIAGKIRRIGPPANSYDAASKGYSITSAPAIQSWPAQTIALWFKPRAYGAGVQWKGLLNQNNWGTGGTNTGGFGLYMNKATNQLGYEVGPEGGPSTRRAVFSTPVGNPSLNVWHFVVCRYNGTVAEMWLDGVYQGSSTSTTGTLNNLAALLLSTGTLLYDGLLSRVKIWNRALTSGEITALNLGVGNNIQDYVLYLPLDEGSLPPKEQVNGLTLTLDAGIGTVTTSTDVPPSPETNVVSDVMARVVGKLRSFGYKASNSLLFNGVDNGLVTSGVQSAIDNLTDFTIVWWMYPTSTSAISTPNIITKNYSNNNSFIAYFTSNTYTLNWRTVNNTGVGVSVSSSYMNTNGPNKWYRIVVTYKASTGAMNLYIDGVSRATGTNTNVVNAGTTALLGINSASTIKFGGNMSDLRIYKREWTSQEVADDFKGVWVKEPDFWMPFNEGTGFPKDVKNGITTAIAQTVPGWDTLLPIGPETNVITSVFTRSLTHLRTFANTITLSSSMARTLAKFRIWATNTIVVGAGTMTRKYGAVRTLPNTTTVGAETFARAIALIRLISNTVPITGTLARGVIYLRSFTSTINITDAMDQTFVYLRSFTNTITTSDTWAYVRGKAGSFTETVDVADSWIRSGEFSSLFTENVTVGAGAFARAYGAVRRFVESNDKPNLVIPLFLSPASNAWQPVIDAITKYKSVLNFVLIINVSNGPGVSVDSNYTSALAAIRTAEGISNSVRILGYVYTTQGTRAITTVESEIDSWFSFYGSYLNGIYFDQLDSLTGHEAYYQQARDYAYSKGFVGGGFVWAAPNGPTTSSYVPIVDVLVIANQSELSLPIMQSRTFNNAFAKTKFAAYVTNNISLDRAYLEQVLQPTVGYAYLTPDSDFDTIPSYLDSIGQELARSGISVSDSFGRLAGRMRDITDTITTSDTWDRIYGQVRTFIESIGTNDSWIRTFGWDRRITETVNISAVIARAGHFVRLWGSILYDHFDSIYDLITEGELSVDGKWRQLYRGVHPTNISDVGRAGVRIAVTNSTRNQNVLYGYPYAGNNTTANSFSTNVTLTELAYGEFDTTFYMRTIKQLRTVPKNWETCNFVFRYNEADGGKYHYYYFVLKMSGWEFGRRDTTNQLNFNYIIASSGAFTQTIKQWYKVRVRCVGFAPKISVAIWLDDVKIVDLLDDGSTGDPASSSIDGPPPHPPLAALNSGKMGLFSLDSENELDYLHIIDAAHLGNVKLVDAMGRTIGRVRAMPVNTVTIGTGIFARFIQLLREFGIAVYDNYPATYDITTEGAMSPDLGWLFMTQGVNPQDALDKGQAGVRLAELPSVYHQNVFYIYPYAGTNFGIDNSSAMVVSTAPYFDDFDVTIRMRTIRSLRDTPRLWETAWLVWHMNDSTLSENNSHHYHLVIKRNGGIEIARRDNDQNSEIHYLLFDSGPGFVVYNDSQWYKVRIFMVGYHIKVWVEDNLVCDIIDDGSVGTAATDTTFGPAPHPPSILASEGRFAFFAQDAIAEFQALQVNQDVESIPVTDVFVRPSGAGISRTFNEIVNAPDIMDRIVAMPRSFAENVIVDTDTWSRIVGFTRTITDDIIASAGTFIRSIQAVRAFIENVPSLDEFRGPLLFTRFFNEVVDVADNISRTIGKNRVFNEVTNSSDSFVRRIGAVRTFVENLIPTDAFNRIAGYSRSFIEPAVNVLDQFISSRAYSRVFSNAISLSDSFLRRMDFVRYFKGLIRIYSANLDGISSYIDVADNPILRNLTSFTISFWIFPRGYGPSSTPHIINKGYPNPSTFLVYFDINGRLLFLLKKSNSLLEGPIFTTATNTINTWYHVVARYTGTEIRLFVDGVSQANAIAGSETYDSPLDLLINGFPSVKWDGNIADVRIWRRDLSNAEVAELADGEGPFDMDVWLPLNEGTGNAMELKKGITVTFVNNVTWTLAMPIKLIEKVAVSSTMIRTLAAVRIFSGSVALSDSFIRKFGAVRTFANAITNSDNWSSQIGRTRTFVENMIVNDTTNRAINIIRNFNEAVGIIDTWSRLTEAFRTFVNTIILSDVWDVLAGRKASFDETIPVSDAISRKTDKTRTFSNNTVIGSGTFTRLTGLFRTITENVLPTDSLNRFIGYTRNTWNESVNVAGNFGRSISTFRSFVQNIIVNDIMDRLNSALRGFNETVNVADNTWDRLLEASRSFANNVVISGTMQRSIALFRDISNAVINGPDVVSRKLTAFRAWTELPIVVVSTMGKEIFYKVFFEEFVTVFSNFIRSGTFTRKFTEDIELFDTLERLRQKRAWMNVTNANGLLLYFLMVNWPDDGSVSPKRSEIVWGKDFDGNSDFNLNVHLPTAPTSHMDLGNSKVLKRASCRIEFWVRDTNVNDSVGGFPDLMANMRFFIDKFIRENRLGLFDYAIDIMYKTSMGSAKIPDTDQYSDTWKSVITVDMFYQDDKV